MADVDQPGTHRDPVRGQFRLRDNAAPPESRLTVGRFGRMFRNLPAHHPDPAWLKQLARKMVEGRQAEDAEALPAGLTYLGQFIDHDLTFDTASNLERQNDPDALVSFRTPGYDLDSVYGRGPAAQPYLYARGDRAKLLIGQGDGGPVLSHDGELRVEDDLPRNRDQIALLGDPRNDENVIVGQLHLAFLKLHNRLVDDLRGGDGPVAAARWAGASDFDEAQRLARWHYQWIVLTEFLPAVCDPDVFTELCTRSARGWRITPRWYRFEDRPFIPVEWSVAAYRFGHSMIRPGYDLNATLTGFRGGKPIAIFIEDPDQEPLEHLAGDRLLPAFWTVDWRLFFDFPGEQQAQRARTIDTKLAGGLRFLPGITDGAHALALRNLQRGASMSLPSGQAVARRLGVEPLTAKQLGFGEEAPLWFYILKEAEIDGQGERLGFVGSTIVAETMLGLLEADPFSFIRTDPTWEPVIPGIGQREPHDFRMADLLHYAVPVDGRDLQAP